MLKVFNHNSIAQKLPIILMGLLVINMGCSTISSTHRAEQTDLFLEELSERTEQELAEKKTLNLDDCIEIGLRNNLKLKTAKLNSEIAKLGKNIAFSAFLPQVNYNVSVTTWDHQPKNNMGGGSYIGIHDKTLHESSLDFQMPILVPATWFLFSMRKHGSEIGELLEDYTSQMIALEITGIYFDCLRLAESKKTLMSQLKTSRVLAKEVALYLDEGIALEWQVNQAKAELLARKASLRETQRALRERKLDLMVALGLSPLAPVNLEISFPLELPEEDLTKLALRALNNHPQLHIADRQVAIAQDQAKIILAEFLPKLAGFTSFTTTSESTAKYSNAWLGGVSGVVSIFNGFRDVQEYRIASKKETLETIAREEFCLSLLAQVFEAYQNEITVKEYLDVSKQVLLSSEGRLAEIEEKAREGLVLASEKLQAISERDQAQVQFESLQYQHQLTIAVLLNAIGESYRGEQGN